MDVCYIIHKGYKGKYTNSARISRPLLTNRNQIFFLLKHNTFYNIEIDFI